MNREEFFVKLAALDEDRLRKALWTLYWRGTAQMRERIEAELEPRPNGHRQRQPKQPPDPGVVLTEVRDFAELARSGAYLGGSRRVSPRERTRWRFTFQRLAADAQDSLRHDDLDTAVAAAEQLVDLAREMKERDYVRSEDPIEAARFVVSDVAAELWTALRKRHGFAGFAERAAPQLVRWESKYGWTRTGWGRIPEKECSLASVLAPMLPIPDTWVSFADHYLEALDHAGAQDAARPRRVSGFISDRDWTREQRTANLAEWHLLLLERLTAYDAGDRLDKLVAHAALGGPELTFIQARLAHLRDDLTRARDLVHQSLEKLPGHQGFLDFAAEIGATLPARAQQIAHERTTVGSA